MCETLHILGQLVHFCRVEAKVVCSSGCTCCWDSSGCVTARVSGAVWKIGIQAKHWRFTGFVKHYENEGFPGFQISLLLNSFNLCHVMLEISSATFLRLGLVLSSAASIFDLYHWLTSSPKRRSSWRFFFLRWAILCILQSPGPFWKLQTSNDLKVFLKPNFRHQGIPFPTKNV